MTENAETELSLARLALVQSLPAHLTSFEKKQIRNFLQGLLNLRQDEVSVSSELKREMMSCDYAPYPWKDFGDILMFFSLVFENRETAGLYKDDLQGFREYIDYVGTEFEQNSTPAEIQNEWETITRFGFAQDWDWKVHGLLSALAKYWQSEREISFLVEAVRETLHTLCLPIFKEEIGAAILNRWADFSDNFTNFEYFPRKPSSLGFINVKSNEVYF